MGTVTLWDAADHSPDDGHAYRGERKTAYVDRESALDMLTATIDPILPTDRPLIVRSVIGGNGTIRERYETAGSLRDVIDGLQRDGSIRRIWDEHGSLNLTGIVADGGFLITIRIPTDTGARMIARADREPYDRPMLRRVWNDPELSVGPHICDRLECWDGI